VIYSKLQTGKHCDPSVVVLALKASGNFPAKAPASSNKPVAKPAANTTKKD